MKRKPPKAPAGRAALPALSDLIPGYGQRLRLVRKAIAPNAKALAEALGVSPQRWSHWENERHPPDLPVMLALKQWREVSLDWIYAGDPSGLRGSMIQQMLGVVPDDDIAAAQTLLRATMMTGATGPGAMRLQEPPPPPLKPR